MPSFVLSFNVEIVESKLSRRSAVRSSAWLGLLRGKHFWLSLCDLHIPRHWNVHSLAFERIPELQPDVAERSLHPDILPQERGNIQVLTFNNCRFAFFEAAPGYRLKLQNFLFGVRVFFGHRFGFFFRQRFFLWRN